jgi:signal transduction histidine kinase
MTRRTDEAATRREPRDLRILVRVLTPLIIVGLATAALFDYLRATRETEAQFNEKQVYLARQAADRLAEVFREVRKCLVIVGGVYSATTAHEPRAAALEAVVAQLDENGAVAAGRVKGDGSAGDAVGVEPQDLVTLSKSIPPCREGAFCIGGPVRSRLSKAEWVLVATLVLNGSRSGGSLLLVLDWGILQGLIGRITKLSPETYSWVLDYKGRLVMHPNHADQLGHDAIRIDAACSRCHTSFELHRRMASGGVGFGRVQIIGMEPKIAAFTPVEVGTRRWSLAVATPASQIAREGARTLLSIFLFTGAIMLVMVAGGMLLDREASRRIREGDRFNRELEQKVAERTAEAGALYSRLAALQAHHTQLERLAVAGEMASIVAHEVRTPLNALSINAQMIGRRLGRNQAGDRDKALEAVGTLQGEIQRINQLLEEHLLSVVRHRPATLVPLSLNVAVEEAARYMETEASRQGVSVALELEPGLPRVSADEGKLRQVLINILLNAIQAIEPSRGDRALAESRGTGAAPEEGLPPGKVVQLSTGPADGGACVTVKDTGPGFGTAIEGNLEHVVKPFTTTKENGTGLGLAICVRLMKEMNGTIHVSSEPGLGATFRIVLPRSKEAEEK